MVFLKKKISPQKIKKILPFFYATFQCGCYGVFKKKLKYFFDPERASKVAHNRPRPFYFTVQARPTAHSPESIFHIRNCWDQTSVLLSVHKFHPYEGQKLVVYLFLLYLFEKMQTQHGLLEIYVIL